MTAKTLNSKKYDVVLLMMPLGEAFAIPFSIGYLKSALQSQNISCKCIDINIKLLSNLNLLEKFSDSTTNNQKYAEKDHILDYNSWRNEETFHNEILTSKPLNDEFNKLVDQVIEHNPQIIGFSIFHTTLQASIEFAKRLKKKSPNINIVFGGPDCTLNYQCHGHKNWLKWNHYPKLLLSGVVDYFVIGEGEITFTNLCQYLIDQSPKANRLPGVITQKAGKIRPLKPQSEISNLNSINAPDYSDFDFSDYPLIQIPIAFNRGCNHNCTFCEIKNLWGKRKMRHRSAENITQEINILSQVIPKDLPHFHMSFRGAYLNFSKSILDELSTGLIKLLENNSTTFSWNGYACVHKNLTEERCKRLKQAGCWNLVFGIESGSHKVRKSMNKSFSNELAQEVIKNTSLAGIKVSVFIIVGYPTETEEDFQETLNFIKENSEYIDVAYCVSEFLLGHDMMQSAPNWGIAPHPDFYKWETTDGTNTLPIRKERLQRFYQLTNELNLVDF